MSITELVVSEVIKRIFTSYDRHRAKGRPSHPNLEEALAQHLNDVVAWSERVELFGFASGKETETATIDLFLTIPRKFRARTAPLPLSERDFLSHTTHSILLGDPGAGKTTTLKRLVRRMLSTEATLYDGRYAYPVVVRLRELTEEAILEELIADALAVPHERREANEEKLRELGISLSAHPIFALGARLKSFIITSGTVAIVPSLASVLDATEALLVLDGLDEVPTALRAVTERTIMSLAAKLRRATVIASCRSGDYIQPLGGFDAVEIAPLSDDQIGAIAERWCNDPRGFLARLRTLPFQDLATRPLFLCQLILLYESTGFLPADPSAVYRRVVRLALEEWDRQKRVSRESRYAKFDPDRKLRFLSHLAFQLTYVVKSTHFKREALASAYISICGNFDLPPRDAINVVRELETHTGILVEAGPDAFEFSHLSLQEYLCAEFLVGTPITDKIARFIVQNPAPIAVAVAVSSYPSRWLAALFLRKSVARVLDRVNLSSFFARLEQESPVLAVDKRLGFAALRILFSHVKLDEYTDRFLRRPDVEASILTVLPLYTAEVTKDYRLTLKSYQRGPNEGDLPAAGRIPKERIRQLERRAAVQFKAIE